MRVTTHFIIQILKIIEYLNSFYHFQSNSLKKTYFKAINLFYFDFNKRIDLKGRNIYGKISIGRNK